MTPTDHNKVLSILHLIYGGLNLVSLLIPNGTAAVELAAYALMIAVLLIRPGGLMGVKEA